MATTKRLTITVDKQLYTRLVRLTERGRPHLPKRYVVELALERLLDAIDEGQVELGVKSDDRHKKG
jgi:hypothetical protein